MDCPCGRPLDPDPFEVDGKIWIAYVCPTHGIEFILDPFD